MKKYISLYLCFILTFSSVSGAMADGIKYLPDVTSAMSKAEYWTNDNELLMTSDEIEEQNSLTISEKETHMYDLKNQPDFVNTIELNKSILTSSTSDRDYYLGWTYIESNVLAQKNDYQSMIDNTQNPDPKENSAVMYGIAVKRTNLHTFPSHKAIWDNPSDPECNYQYLASVRVNEPLVITSVSNDGKFYLAKTNCCSGWVPAENIAVCKDKEEWLSAWDIPAEKILVVYGDRVYTEMSVTGSETSEVMLSMGTVLEIAENINPNELIDNRSTYQNHVVYMPISHEDGSYEKKLTLISENRKVHTGYLPMTKSNIISVAFESLGNTYGWGNWLNSYDCSGYIRNIYKCFGLELARNTTWQSAMPMTKIDMKNMEHDERVQLLNALPTGSVLYFSGHEMLYLGCENEKHYVISAVGSMMQPENSSIRQRIRSMVINTLDVKRANGNTWLDELTCALIPYESGEFIISKQDTEQSVEYSDNFTDISTSDWYYEDVNYAVENGLFNGTGETTFDPQNSLTRAMLVTVLWRMENEPDVTYTMSFKDIEEDSWYAEAVRWAVSENIVNGYSETVFAPNDKITREQIATIIFRYADKKALTPKGAWAIRIDYADITDISDYAARPVMYCKLKNIMQGKENNIFAPQAEATRAEAAAILHRFININK